MSNLVLGVDAGNYAGKVAGPFGADSYRTAICDWFARDIKETFGHDDMEFEIGNRRGFSGTIAAYEDVFGGGSLYGISKAHEDCKIRVLLGIYRYINRYCPGQRQVSIVTGQPIAAHNDDEKQIITNMLMGRHEFIVNGAFQQIDIEDVRIAAEGSGAFWCNPRKQRVRIIDVGSGTINCATIIENRHINNASETFNFGAGTSKKLENDVEGFARDIIRSTTTLMWDRDDIVLVCGGMAKEIFNFIKLHYKNAAILNPQLKLLSGGIIELSPVFANATGYYEMGRLTYL